jgi:hypothetical protein
LDRPAGGVAGRCLALKRLQLRFALIDLKERIGDGNAALLLRSQVRFGLRPLVRGVDCRDPLLDRPAGGVAGRCLALKRLQLRFALVYLEETTGGLGALLGGSAAVNDLVQLSLRPPRRLNDIV